MRTGVLIIIAALLLVSSLISAHDYDGMIKKLTDEFNQEAKVISQLERRQEQRRGKVQLLNQLKAEAEKEKESLNKLDKEKLKKKK